MLGSYYTRDLWRKRFVVVLYAAIPTLIFLWSGIAGSSGGAFLAVVLALPLLSRHFRNRLWSVTIREVICRTCGRGFPRTVFAQCQHCGFRGFRHLFSPCPNCNQYLCTVECPTCNSDLLLAKEEVKDEQ